MSKTPLKKLSPELFEAIAARFRALGEVNRLKIVQCLQNGECNVSELVAFTALSQPNVSRHLQVLVAAGLVGKRKQGLNVLYRIVDDSLADLCVVVCRGASASMMVRR